jgi:TonB family protein
MTRYSFIGLLTAALGLLPLVTFAQTQKPSQTAPKKTTAAPIKLRPAERFSPTGNGPHDSTLVYQVAEQMPQPPGGGAGLETYLAQNLRVPAEVKSGAVAGKVVVRFAVMASGRLADLQVVRSLSPATDAEALRVLGAMPRWSPAKQNGAVATVEYTVPITFGASPSPKR